VKDLTDCQTVACRSVQVGDLKGDWCVQKMGGWQDRLKAAHRHTVEVCKLQKLVENFIGVTVQYVR